MGVLTYTDEHTSSVSPARTFKASIVDSHNLMPKLLPDATKSINIVKGDGGAGSIKENSHNLMPKLLPEAIKSISFIKGDGGAGSIKEIKFAGRKVIFNPIYFVKHHINELNEKTLTYKYTLIEGEGISDKIEKVSYDIKFEGSPDGGTISKMTTTIYTHGDFELKEKLKAGKEEVLGLYKVVEVYLLKNPDAYI
ncbi:Bet v I domain-containing protein [Cynara cardunculus var. scolymus]|uniref:Bet v I domain-containing protein n=1 Tax=Cynara cardunculus var. scolymus TaxID=59895 RepID=A0A103YI35_CYNCS|nr:Bet v I domain-containing protein [Cynara cardunculus var. scolymus]